MLAPFFLSFVLSVGQPGPAFLPWPAEAGPDPTLSARPAAAAPRPAVTPGRRATATLAVEVIEDDLPSFPIPIRRTAAGGTDLPSFAIPVRRAAAPGAGSPR